MMEQEISLLSLRKLAAEPLYSDVTLLPVQRVVALGKLGRSVDVDQDLSPRLYLRSGLDMERMASVYHQEGSLENAYVLYNKFITLFVEKLPLHKDYHQVSTCPEKVYIMKKLKDVAFPRRDELKKRLEEKYSSEYTEYFNKSQSAAEGCGQRPPLLAVDPVGHALLLADSSGGRDQWLEVERRRVAELRKRQIESEQFLRFEQQLQKQELANHRAGAQVAPLKGCDITDGSCISQRPIKAAAQSQGVGPYGTKATPVQSISARSQYEESLDWGEGLSRGDSLRRVVLPRDLTRRFLLLAESNTIRGTETCGVLCGRLSRDELLVSHVVIPKQTSGPDFCDMENVEELFQIQDQHNLLTLGWIHTHPTQTSFLSSVDLHTHCSFQLMLPEAIAVVCAPRHNDVGVFRLSAAGVFEVSRCRLKGFHPHSKEPPLFTVCKHVLLRDCAVILLDLR